MIFVTSNLKTLKYMINNRQSGLSLVEIMVAMLISLVLLGGALTVMMRSKDSSRVNEDLARLQENLRVASEMMTRDLRMTGFMGCARFPVLTNLLTSVTTGSYFDMTNPIEGVEGGTTNSVWKPSDYTGLATAAEGGKISVPGTDAITMRALSTSAGFSLSDAATPTVAPMTAGTDPIKVLLPLPAGQTIKAGNVMAINDCVTTHIFQVTDFNATTGEVFHAAGGGYTPGNSTADLGKVYTTGRLTLLNNVRYFIATNTDGFPSLYRQVFESDVVATGNLAIQELVPGIENLQVLYGEDISGDRNPDRYRVANDVAYQNVVSIRLGLLGRTVDLYGSETDNNTYDVNGKAVTAPGDRRIRKVFSTSVSLRNLQ